MMNLYKRGGTTIYCSPHQLFYSKLRQQPFVSHFSLHMSSHKNINAPKLDYHDSL